MSYKIDTVISQLDEIAQRLERIEKIIAFSNAEIMPTEAIDKAFEKVLNKTVDKPQLHVVQSDNETDNVVEFKADET